MSTGSVQGTLRIDMGAQLILACGLCVLNLTGVLPVGNDLFPAGYDVDNGDGAVTVSPAELVLDSSGTWRLVVMLTGLSGRNQRYGWEIGSVTSIIPC